jgi:hypothetical protein
MHPVSLGPSLRVAVVTALAALTLLVPTSLAQTPVSEADTAQEAHPAHIHSGTCDQLGDVVIPLEDVAVPADATHEGAASAHDVKISQTHVDMPLQDLLDGDYAINVHESADAIDVYIACGDIGGYVITDPAGRTELFVGLRELNDSGHTGVARLGIGEDPNQTEVSNLLIEPDEMQEIPNGITMPPRGGGRTDY